MTSSAHADSRILGKFFSGWEKPTLQVTNRLSPNTGRLREFARLPDQKIRPLAYRLLVYTLS